MKFKRDKGQDFFDMMSQYSQNGESEIVFQILHELRGDVKPSTFNSFMIEIGAGDGYQFSNTRVFKEMGWNVDMYDCDNHGNHEVTQMFINRNNVKDIFNLGRHYTFFSIDIDGNDFSILNEILQITKPDIICFEINSQLPLDKVLVMPYNEDHKWDGSWFYGMSYLAGAYLCRANGYKIYDVANNTNIIAVREEFKIKPKLYSFGLTWSHPEDDRKFQEITPLVFKIPDFIK